MVVDLCLHFYSIIASLTQWEFHTVGGGGDQDVVDDSSFSYETVKVPPERGYAQHDYLL
jgi:hypothetical protein